MEQGKKKFKIFNRFINISLYYNIYFIYLNKYHKYN